MWERNSGKGASTIGHGAKSGFESFLRRPEPSIWECKCGNLPRHLKCWVKEATGRGRKMQHTQENEMGERAGD